MKLILFVIFIIIEFNLILSKNLRSSDIFKRSKSKKNLNSKKKTKKTNETNDSNKKSQKNLEEPNVVIPVSIPNTKSGPPIGDQSDGTDNTEELLIKRILFIVCCLKGGLTSDEQILNAYNWALENKYKINDKYNVNDLAEKISNQFESTFHEDWKIRRPKNGKKGVFSSITKNGEVIFKPDELRNSANGNLSILFEDIK